MNRSIAPTPGQAAAIASQFKQEGQYWQEKLSGQWVKSSFPYDSIVSDGPEPLQAVPGDRFPEAVEFECQGELFGLLSRLMNKSDSRLQMILTACLLLLLDRYMPGNPGCIVVGAPVLKQEKAKDFINTVLTLKIDIQGCLSFKDLLLQVRETIVQATDNQNYPLELLLRKLDLSFSFDGGDEGFPLFEVALLLENIHDKKHILPVRPRVIFSFRREETSLLGRIEYDPRYYIKENIQRIARHFYTVMENALPDVNKELAGVEILPRDERRLILEEFNGSAADYPKDSSIQELFDSAARQRPHKIAVVAEDHCLTYEELDKRANRLANYLVQDRGVRPGQCIGVMMEKSADLIVAVLGVLKAGAVYVPIDFNFPLEVIKNMIDDAAIEVVISRKRHIGKLNRLQWECPAFHSFLCMDSACVRTEEEREKSELMGRKLWEYVGEKATDQVTGGGWLSSYTGLPIPDAQMDEYGGNILKKLKPLLHKKMRVLEIGCASGISMYRIAPLVGLYYGTDISGVIIEKNRQRIHEEGHENIRLARLAAHEIGQVEEDGFDLVIINSVIQCFHGHNYLRRVLSLAVDKLADQGYLFIGDIMDQDKKSQLIADLTAFKQANREKDYKTKVDWSVEVFISRDFLLDLRVEMPVIRDASFSGKIYTMENELTRYRYDALLTIDKSAGSGEELPVKHKHQHDLRDLMVQETQAPALPPLPHEPGRLAYIMYTSGSTGRPKGVMVEHHSVVRLVKNTNYVEFPEDGKILQTGALAFDASTFEIWGSLLNGMTLYLVSKEKLLSTEALKRVFLEYGITTIFMTTALFNQLSERDITIFASLNHLLVGGDVASPLHFNRVLEELPGVNFVHCYGPTENTTFSTTYPLLKEHTGHVPIGGPIGNSTCYILDIHGNLAPIGCVGELYVGGEGVARGYLNRPELTAEKFTPLHSTLLPPNMRNSGGVGSPLERGARRAGCVHSGTGAPLYRTGDLARWQTDGNIHFIGRIDTQVKIRGFRIELEEIENRLLEIDGILNAVVIARGSGSGQGENKDICAYFVTEEGILPGSSEIREYLSQRLPEFMVPAFLVRLERIPLTANGKVDRRALPEPVLAGGQDRARPETPLQRRLAELWSQVLDREAQTISIDDNFFQCGGHSLKATVLATKIHQALDVKIPLAEIFRLPTIRETAVYIEEDAGFCPDKHHAIEVSELKEYYPLSSAQLRLYILCRWEPENIFYNVPTAILLRGDLDREKLTAVFGALLNRHESFRTAFIEVDSQPYQRIFPAEDIPFELEYFDVSGLAREEKESRTREIVDQTFIRPFDLTRAPLLRVGLVKQSERRHVLMVDMHHSISDGTSLRILLREFSVLYGGGQLPELPLQYRDFALWHRREMKESLGRQESFWLEQFSGQLPVLTLPYDFQRPAVMKFDGGFLNFSFSAPETTAINDLAGNEGVTLYMLLLASFNILMSKLSGLYDIIAGSPVAGRGHADLQHMVGMFVNTLAFRNFPLPSKTFRHFLKEVKTRTLTAYDNQDYQFEDLVDRLGVNRDTSRGALFDVVFALHNIELTRGFIPEAGKLPGGLTLESFPAKFDVSKFDLSFHGWERDGVLSFNVEFATALFTESTIRRFIKYFKNTVTSVLENPGWTLGRIDIMDPEEKTLIREMSNGPELSYDRDASLHGLFRDRAETFPRQLAVIDPGKESGASSLTYEQLNSLSREQALGLKEAGVRGGDIVAVKMERSCHMVVAILAILKAGAAYLPIDTQYPEARINYILEDSAADILVTDQGIIHRHSPGKSSLSEHSAHDTAYVIYTSGTTGRPKGTVVLHRGVVNMVHAHWRAFGNEPFRRVTQVAGPGFDAMAFEIWPALLKGDCIYMVPGDVRMDAGKLKEFLLEKEITGSFQSTAIAAQLIRMDWPANGTALEYLWTAGDRLTSFPQRKLPFGFYNLYGLTEASVWSTWTEVTVRESQSPGPVSPSIGKPVANHQLYILDPVLNLLPLGVPGEICIGGRGVALGYLNRPELTAEKFIPSPFTIHSSLIYKTGDLGRWLAGGNIEFLGRIDHQVKIRGFRIEPGEIEALLLKYPAAQDTPGIQQVLVKAIDPGNSGGLSLCAYIQSATPPGQDELREYLEGLLPVYMVPAHFVFLERFKLTASGKVDLNALPLPGADDIAAAGSYVPPAGRIEELLVETWSEILELPRERIGVKHNFFSLGGQSLKATILVSRIHKRLGVKLKLTDIFKYPVIAGLARLVKEKVPGIFEAIPAVEERDYYPCSSAQRRLYFISRVDTLGIGYNMPQVLPLEKALDAVPLQQTLRRLIHRHESLRTSFTLVKGEPVQRVHRHIEFTLDSPRQLSEMSGFLVPFDLSKAPLLRACLAQDESKRNYLLIDMHHIISDAVSNTLLTEDFMALFQEEALAPLRIQYKDFTMWRWQGAGKEILTRQKSYWLDHMAGEIPVLELPYDYPRPQVRSFEGDLYAFFFDEARSRALEALAASSGATLYTVLFAIFNVLLSRLSGKEDIIIGTPVAGRGHDDLLDIIGMFVNTLAIRSYPDNSLSFQAFLGQVGENVLSAFENQEYPLEDLLEQLPLNRDAGRNPLFDVVFALENTGPRKSGEANADAADIGGPRTAKFDLTVNAVETDSGLIFSVEYCTRLFKPESIERLLRYYDTIAGCILDSPGIILADIDFLDDGEKHRLLYEFNDTAADYPRGKSIDDLFVEQAEQTPDRVALVGEYSSFRSYMTYKELNRQADAFRWRLLEAGAGAGDIVAIMADHNVAMMVGVLAILKAGAAYMPVNKNYPAARKSYLLKDAAVRILLTDAGDESSEAETVIAMDRMDLSPDATIKARRGNGDDLAYVMYTSGSTGLPKGTLVTHRNVVRLVKNIDYIQWQDDERLMQTGALEFDASTFEIWGALLNGFRVYPVDREVILRPGMLKEALIKDRITTLFMTTTLFNQVLDKDISVFSTLNNLLVGGDVASPVHFNRICKELPDIRFIHCYGPTENTTFSSTYPVTAEHTDQVPIGRPITNSTAYILDANGNLLPVGCAGELCLGGEGVALGYLNRPELTAEKFTPFTLHPSLLTVYKTGDLARWMEDGNIEFLGRIDQQVKIRGFRVELEEIENRLLMHDVIKQAAVLAQKRGETKELCAYIVAAARNEPALTVPEMREYLAGHLPDYMIPSHFFQLDVLPLTPNGKLDRKALVAYSQSSGDRLGTGVEYAAPRSGAEVKLAEIWKEVLQVENPGLYDNFFDLGGTSMTLLKLNSRLKEEFDRDVPIVSLFQYSTIAALAGFLGTETTETDQQKAKHQTIRKDTISKGKNRIKRMKRNT